MNLQTRSEIARATLSILTVVVVVFLIGLVVLVLCAGLQINPFKETTTSFLIALFVGLIGVAAVLVLLNVATNLSLIAEARIAELRVEPRPAVLKKWSAAFAIIAVTVAAVIFGGTYFSKQRFLSVVHTQADDVLKENKNLLDEVSRLLASGKVEDYKRIFEISTFLASQRSGLPQLTLIYSGTFGNKLALYDINSSYFPGDIKKGTYTPAYFPCTKNRDCDYLGKFFSGEDVPVLEKYTVRDDQFYIYVPITSKETRFVLLFERTNSYGKLGS